MWLYSERHSHSSVAAKVFKDQRARRLAVTEAQILDALEHPNVLCFRSFFSTLDASYLVTEFLSGGDLLSKLQSSRTPLGEAASRGYFTQLLSAVDYLHKQGFIHRDIKCENLLLSSDKKQLILADFGFACGWSQESTLTEQCGSLHYSSPEITGGSPYVGPEVDVWSMGVVLYAMCSARLPFGGSNEEDIAERIILGNFSVPVGISSSLTLLLRGCMHPIADQRITIELIKRHSWILSSDISRFPTEIVLPAAAPVIVASPRRASVPDVPRVPPPQRRVSAPEIATTPQQRNGDSIFARLSRYTISGVKQFSLSKLIGKKR